LKIIKSFLITFACFSFLNANLLDGYYQVTNLIITQDERPRGFNNSHLYIEALSGRIRLAGAWRSIPIRESLTVERVVGDTLFLRDNNNRSNHYKFHVRADTISGRHAVAHENGSRQVIETRAVLRKLNRQEIEQIKRIGLF